MNTANLQLEGLCAAVAALAEALRAKGLLSGAEIEDALMRAEDGANRADSGRVSPSNADAIVFPIRYLRIANQASLQGRHLSFGEIAKMVGESKPPHADAAGGSHMATPVGGEVRRGGGVPPAQGAGAAGASGRSQRGSHSEPQGDMKGAMPSSDHPMGEAEFLDMATSQEVERDA